MKKKEYLYVIVSVIFFILGGFFCFKSINTTKTSAFSEKGTVNYTVCLKENSYYKDTCLSEGREYLTSLTDNYKINFSYNRISEFRNELVYYVGTELKVLTRDSDKELYSKGSIITEKKSIKNEKQVTNIVENVDIKFDSYQDLVLKYSKDYNISTSSILQVYLLVSDGKKEKIVASVDIPIGEQTYSITKNELDSSKDVIVDESYKSELLIGIIAIVISIVIILMVIYKNIKQSKTSEFELEVNRLLTEYDRVVVETKIDKLNLTGKELIEINDFMELIDVRDTIEKPIMYLKRNNYVRDFIVQDGDIVYRYRMIEEKHSDGDYDDPIVSKIESNKGNTNIDEQRDIFHTKTIEIPKLSEEKEKGENEDEE